MIFKLNLHFLILALLSSLTLQAQLKGDFYKDAKTTKKAELLCVFNQTSGFSYKNEKGEIKGFCIDVMHQFADYVKTKEGINVSLKFEEEKAKEFNVFLDHVKNGKGGVFGLGSITVTEERGKLYNLSPRVMKSLTFIVTHKDIPDLRSPNDMPTAFKGFSGYAVKGTSFEKRLLTIREKYYPAMPVLNKTPGLDSFEQLLNKKNTLQNIDFIGYLTVLKKDMPVKRHSVLDEKEDLCFVLSQSNDWSTLFKEFLNSGFTESAAYRKIIADNFGAHSLKLLDSVK